MNFIKKYIFDLDKLKPQGLSPLLTFFWLVIIVLATVRGSIRINNELIDTLIMFLLGTIGGYVSIKSIFLNKTIKEKSILSKFIEYATLLLAVLLWIPAIMKLLASFFSLLAS